MKIHFYNCFYFRVGAPKSSVQHLIMFFLIFSNVNHVPTHSVFMKADDIECPHWVKLEN